MTVYHFEYPAYLSWSQGFIHRLIEGLAPSVEQAVITPHHGELGLRSTLPVELLGAKALRDPRACQLAARQLLDRYGSGVMHAHFGTSGVNGLLLSLTMGLPMVVSFGGRDLSVEARRPEAAHLYGDLFALAERFIAVSSDLRAAAIEIGCPPEKIEVVRRGVDTEAYRFSDRAPHAGPVRLLMVSRLIAKKGHADAFAALARTGEPGRDWTLRVVGEGEEEARLRRLADRTGIANAIEFAGRRSEAEVQRELERADLLLHPSVSAGSGDREGIPNAVLEAQATGLPVIATRHGGIPELVIEGETGLLVGEGAAEELATAISTLLRDSDRRCRLARAARLRIEREFSLERQVERHRDLYRELERVKCASWEGMTETARGELLERLSATRREARALGDLSVLEVLEGALPGRRGLHRAEPAWYRAYRWSKRHVPRALRFRVMRALR